MAKRSKTKTDWLEGGSEQPAGFGPGEVHDLRTIAQIFGMTIYAVRQCIDRGAPVVHRPRSKLEQWQIAAGEFLQWLTRDALAQRDTEGGRYIDAKARLATAKWERLRDDNAARRAELVTLDQVLTVLREESAILRNHLHALPADIAAALAKLSADDRQNPNVVEDVMQDAINAAMADICADNGVGHARAAA